MLVSVVIPTVGRKTLAAAVSSALDQTSPVHEVIVVADTNKTVAVPDDGRIKVVHTGGGQGSANARQQGVEAATGDVIALLDDDDLWHPYKIERQLAEIRNGDGGDWVVACRSAVRRTGKREKVWPRRVITSHQSVPDYLFRMTGVRMGGGMLQSSTLCFPRSLALRVPLNDDPDAVHDEPTWCIRVQKDNPQIVFRQLSDCLSVYNVTADSASRRHHDDSDDYVRWGLAYLTDSTARVRGDYFLTSAVSAAARAGSVSSVRQAISTGFEQGRPGAGAIVYAGGKLLHAAVNCMLAGRGESTPA
jgi:glycosyltransferase involved in cell wall biosynthesis